MRSPGRVSLAGVSESLDYPTTADAFSRVNAGDEDVVLSRLDASGADLLWSSYLGGDAGDIPFALASPESGSLFVAGLTGFTQQDPFPTTPGAYDEILDGWSDAFLCRFALPAPSAVPSRSGACRDWVLQADPNPFRSSTTIRFQLPRAARVSLSVHDPTGRRLRILARESPCEAGAQTVVWDGMNDAGMRQASGVYLLRLETRGASSSRKLALMR